MFVLIRFYLFIPPCDSLIIYLYIYKETAMTNLYSLPIILLLAASGLLIFSGCNSSAAKAEPFSASVTAQSPSVSLASTSTPISKTAQSNKLDPSTKTTPSQTFPFDITLKNADGKSFNSKDIFKNNGKPTVLFFWLTTCKPCHMKLSAIAPLYPQWKEETEFNAFAISGDHPSNHDKFVSQTKSKNWEWDTYLDVNHSFKEVLPGKLNGYPQTFIFDKNGKLVYQDKRYRPGDAERLYEKIKEISNG